MNVPDALKVKLDSVKTSLKMEKQINFFSSDDSDPDNNNGGSNVSIVAISVYWVG